MPTPKMYIGVECLAEDCDLPARKKGYCCLHYNRWKRHGDPSIVLQERRGWSTNNGYIMIRVNKVSKYEHILVAEKALGKQLPKGAEVHHWNNNGFDNRPTNLVVCPSKSYHNLLHARMKKLSYEGG